MPEKKYHHGDLKNALIQAGIELLSLEGVGSLSLRKVALRAGVSHAAPYAHFADKQALIAAISTEGYRKIYDLVSNACRQNAGDPLKQLLEAGWAYLQFAMQEPDHFKITLSSAVTQESVYPALVESAVANFEQVVEIVQSCQEAGILRPGPSDLSAVVIWGTVHGITTLVLEKLVYQKVLEQYGLRSLLISAFNQITLVPIPLELA